MKEKINSSERIRFTVTCERNQFKQVKKILKKENGVRLARPEIPPTIIPILPPERIQGRPLHYTYAREERNIFREESFQDNLGRDIAVFRGIAASEYTMNRLTKKLESAKKEIDDDAYPSVSYESKLEDRFASKTTVTYKKGLLMIEHKWGKRAKSEQEQDANDFLYGYYFNSQKGTNIGSIEYFYKEYRRQFLNLLAAMKKAIGEENTPGKQDTLQWTIGQLGQIVTQHKPKKS